MEIHSWKEVIRYFLEQNDTRHLWDYVTALRSGDGVHDTWKFLITCLIRGKDLDGMGWDIDTSKDFFNTYGDDYIQDKLNITRVMVSWHYFIHSRMGLSSLAAYYKDVKNDKVIYNLLLRLESKISNNDFEDLSSLIRQILNILYNNE